MFWTTEHFQCANCAKPQKYLLSFELVCHCQCLAHIQLVHSISWTREHIQCSSPQKCVPSFEPLSCTYWAGALIVLNNIPNKATPSGEKSFMPGWDGFDEKCKKRQSWRPRRWLCRLLPELQMCKFHAWCDSGKTHIYHPAARTPMYSMINNHPHYGHFW